MPRFDSLNSRKRNDFSKIIEASEPPEWKENDNNRTILRYINRLPVVAKLEIRVSENNEILCVYIYFNIYKKYVIRAMMMTACDVAAITKPWPIQQTVSIEVIERDPFIDPVSALNSDRQKQTRELQKIFRN